MQRIVWILVCACLVTAQTKRPRIGLALEGGAALGFAHVGVLEWMEENRIPIDAIAGTSMGGLIGGLYASGLSPAQIREVAKTAEWDKLLGGESSFRDLAYRRKEDKIAFPNRLDLGLRRDGLLLPAAFNDGHAIGILLSRLLVAYPALKSFDELPTPFRCVAADLVSGRAKVFDSGNLGEALRSTMSIPALFAPVRTEKEAFVDGGLLDNLPVDVARAMNVDIVIAVHLSKGPFDPKQIGSIVSIMSRSVSVVIGAAEMRTIERADVVLVADLEKYTTTDYAKSDAIAEVGRQAAAAKANLLKRFAVSEEEFATLRDARTRKTRRPSKQYEFVRVSGAGEGIDETITRDIEGMLRDGRAPEELEREFAKIVGLGRIASLQYRRAEEGGRTGLDVKLSLRATAPVIVNPAIEVNGADTSNSRFSVGSRITWLDPWKFRSEVRTDISFGSRMGISTELYKPFRAGGKLFYAPRAFAGSDIFDIYADKNAVAEYRLRQQGVGADVGWTINRFAELRAGYTFGWLRAKQRIGLPVFPTLSARRETAALRFNFEGQDDNVVPRRGLRFQARAEHYPRGTAALTGYSLGEVGGVYLHAVSKQSSILSGFSAGSTVGPVQATLLTFNIAGPQRLGAYGVNEILTKRYALATFGGIYEFDSEGSLFGSKFFLAGYAQGGQYSDIGGDPRWPVSFTGVALAKTFAGPVFLGGSVGDRGRSRWFFGIGRLF